MEDTLISIDSKYRDVTKYPNESKFTLNFEKMYKNIVSVKLVSIELTNSINYVSLAKNNDYITLYFPNILNDPDGIVITFDDMQTQTIDSIINEFNNQFNNNLLNYYPEKYFYIFYLNNDCQITFDFNNQILPNSLRTKLVIKTGWYSVYGINKIIQNYIQNNYNARQSFIRLNRNTPSIDFDNGNFMIESFTLNVYDKRFSDNIRNDIFQQNNYNINSLIIFQNNFYSLYLTDIINFIPDINGNGILDNLIKNMNSVNFINSINSEPETNNILYNLSLSYNPNTLKAFFINNFNNYYFTVDDWTTSTKFTNNNITIQDIPQYQIDFSNLSKSIFTNNIININSFKYPSIGYYLGFRPVNNSSLLSPIIKNTQLLITGTKNYNVSGDDYIFLRINDWGNFDFFNQILFTKIFLRSDLTTINKTNNFINKEYVFSQLKTINKLDIELVDYLGNTVDLNGIDFSFTLSFRTQTNIGQKQLFDLQKN